MAPGLGWIAPLVLPFVEFGFMRRALVACGALALASGPVGTVLVMRRMTLLGDALAHALLPGAAAGFLLAGLSTLAMAGGALTAALVVALLASATMRRAALREDAALAAFYLTALALGVLMLSVRGSPVDVGRVLFGSVLGVDDGTLLLVAGVASGVLVAFALLYRVIVLTGLDPDAAQAGGWSARARPAVLVLACLTLVAGFVTLGTLMAVGLMMLPAIAARCWSGSVAGRAALAAAIAAVSGWAGLVLSFHLDVPSGPAVVLVAGAACLGSIALGPRLRAPLAAAEGAA